jgi:hypothetical protein
VSPGGKIYIIPITEPITLVLKGQEGNHPEFVFTFEAKTNDRHGHRQGQRYPLTKHVVRYYWDLLGLGSGGTTYGAPSVPACTASARTSTLSSGR